MPRECGGGPCNSGRRCSTVLLDGAHGASCENDWATTASELSHRRGIMASDPSRLDLVRSSATDLGLEADLQIDLGSLPDLLTEYAVSAPGGRRVAFFHTQYRRSRVEHTSIGSVVQGQAEGEEFRVVLTYSVGPAGRVSMPKNTRPVLDMLAMLSDIPQEFAFRCRANFQYAATRYISRVALPLTVSHPSRLPYTDIRGVHLAEVRDGASLYDVIIDHAPSEADTVLHLVSFEYPSVFAPGLPRDVLRFAEDISKEFGESND